MNDNYFNGIHGLLMRPCSLTTEENSKVVHSSEYSVKSDFIHHYNNHIAGMQIVAECAKVYILNNWEKVTDWSRLNVIINDNSGKPTDYYNYIPDNRELDESKVHQRIMARIREENKLRHNPIVSLKEVVLDPTDGDFSLTINDKDHLWISDDSVIIIATYIENELKKL